MSEYTLGSVFPEADVLAELRKVCAVRGAQRRIASALGVSPGFLNDVLKGRRKVNADVANAVGFSQRVTYHKVNLHDA